MPVQPTLTAADRPRVSRQFVADHRRRRCVEAAAEILHEFGRDGLSVTAVVQLARTARNSFYELFSGLEDCIGHGIGVAEVELFAGLEGLSGEGDWLPELEEGIGVFFAAAAARPLLAELFLVHSGGSQTDAGRAAFQSGGEHFVPLLRRGRVEAEALGRPAPPALLDEYLSRAIVALAARRVQRSDVEDLHAESRPVTLLAGGYYLGREAAEETLARGAGPRSVDSSRATSSPL